MFGELIEAVLDEMAARTALSKKEKGRIKDADSRIKKVYLRVGSGKRRSKRIERTRVRKGSIDPLAARADRKSDWNKKDAEFRKEYERSRGWPATPRPFRLTSFIGHRGRANARNKNWSRVSDDTPLTMTTPKAAAKEKAYYDAKTAEREKRERQ